MPELAARHDDGTAVGAPDQGAVARRSVGHAVDALGGKPPGQQRRIGYRWGVILGGVFFGFLYIANVFLTHHTQLYILDKPAVSLSLRASQFAMADGDKAILVTLDFENTGVRDYFLRMENGTNYEKPLKISRITKKNQSGDVSYDPVGEVCLQSSFPEGPNGEWIFRCLHGHGLEPGTRGSVHAVAIVPGPGQYFVEFNVEDPFRSVVQWISEKIDKAPPRRAYTYATAVVDVK